VLPSDFKPAAVGEGELVEEGRLRWHAMEPRLDLNRLIWPS
jgi:hypothetical protein